MVQPPLQNAAASGLKVIISKLLFIFPSPSLYLHAFEFLTNLHQFQELDGISKAAETTNTPEVSNGIGGLEETRNGSSGSSLFGVRLSYPSFITRTRSATQAFASK